MARLNFLKKKKHQDQDDSVSTSSSTKSGSRKHYSNKQAPSFDDQYPGSSSPASSPVQSINKTITTPTMPSVTHRSSPQQRSPPQRSPQVPIQPYRAEIGNVANSTVAPNTPSTPWARFKLFDSPFPRYRHAAASITSEKNEIFLMGGLKEGSVFGDTWKLTPVENHQGEVVNFHAKNLEILNHINPPARVGHSAVLCGNAFVIYGGDTVDTDTQGFPDNNFYLFNTNNCKYTIPSHILNKPNGRYGHTIGVVSLTNSSSRLYLFGGQLENDVFNDLYFFELNSFKAPKASWELVEPINNFKPPPLTNHSMSIYQNQIYIFGGIYNNESVSNDLWSFNVDDNKWTKLITSGYIPNPVNEHSSCIVNDKLYIFGGNDFKGIIYSSLYVLDLQTFVWSKLVDLGEVNGPGPRCGHSMTFLPKYNKIVIMGGDKNDYVDNLDNLEVYEEYRENIVGTMIFQLDLNVINQFLINDPEEKQPGKRGIVRSMSALQEEYTSPVTSPEQYRSADSFVKTEQLRSPQQVRSSPEEKISPEPEPEPEFERSREVVSPLPPPSEEVEEREATFVEVPATAPVVNNESPQDSTVKKIISELNLEIQQLRKSTKEQMEIATEKISLLEQENKSLQESNQGELSQYKKQIDEKDQLINELKGDPGSIPDATKVKLASLELNNKLVYLNQENNQLKDKLNQFEPFMDNQILELDKFQKIIKNQEDKIDQLTNQIKQEESLQKEINELKSKYDSLNLEFSNYKLVHAEEPEEHEELNGADSTERSVSSKKGISNQLGDLISLWNVQKDKQPDTSRENETITQLQSQVDELLSLNKENDQSSEIESLRKQLAEKSSTVEKFENNYKQALQSVNNTSKALKLNQEEFEHQKLLLDKLTKENNELKMFKRARRLSSRGGTPEDSTEINDQPKEDDDDDDDHQITNAHLNIKIKDLEADLYIIKQERDQLKDHVTSLQKELYLERNEK
ncbi:Kelch repeat-containing protein 2 [Spathaspora sp. JA1]|nr:Kelch repeat-containing protein 2 [Spathaspora sp. JA1]